MANAGHAPFWDDAAGYNERLQAFCEACREKKGIAMLGPGAISCSSGCSWWE